MVNQMGTKFLFLKCYIFFLSGQLPYYFLIFDLQFCAKERLTLRSNLSGWWLNQFTLVVYICDKPYFHACKLHRFSSGCLWCTKNLRLEAGPQHDGGMGVGVFKALTHWSRGTTLYIFSNTFPWNKTFEFQIKSHRYMSLRVRFTIFPH